MQAYAYKKKHLLWTARTVDAIGSLIRRPDESRKLQPKRVLIVRLDQLGDIIQTFPFIESLRSSFPSAKISYLTSRVGASLVRSSFPELEVMEWECPWFDSRRKANIPRSAVVEWVHRHNFDAVFELRGDIRLIVLLKQAEVENLVGYGATGGGFLLDVRVPWQPEEHAIDKNLRLLSAIGGKAVQHDPRLPQASPPAGISSQPLIAIHPDAGSPLKCWPLERFIEVAGWLEDQCNARIVFIGANAKMGEQVSMLGRATFKNQMGKTSINKLLDLLSECDGLLTNDSGPAHLMAALDKPVWIVWSETAKKEIWAPRQKKVKVVEDTSLNGPQIKQISSQKVFEEIKKDLSVHA